jgi:ABC-type transport system involved in multi-copper enzyme maturation permease subunit
LLSLIALIVIYANLLTASFFLSAFFYWFLVMLFIFFFSLLGIFISTCTTNPNRSLVYSLLVWLLFSIILPISWDYILSPKLYNDKIVELDRIYRDKWADATRIRWRETPEMETDFDGSFFGYNGRFYGAEIFAPIEPMRYQYRVQRHCYENYYPVAREAELAMDNLDRKRINLENVRSLVFFYNPIVLFSDLGNKITGNSREDRTIFLHTARAIRDDLVSRGAEEGWLFDYRWLATYKEENITGSWTEMFQRFNNDRDKVFEYLNVIMADMDNFEKFTFEMPFIRKYDQPAYTFGEIFNRIFVYLVLFVVVILVLWVLTWYKFMKYDVR